MDQPIHATVTAILHRMSEGESAAAEELLPLVYDELRSMAARLFRSQPAQHTLEPTALVHEAYLKLAVPEPERRGAWQDRAHFLAVAARAMRQVLVNHARDKGAEKRGGKQAWCRVTLGQVDAPRAHEAATPPRLDVLGIHEELEALQAIDPRQGRIAELRIFGGLGLDETAESVGVSRRTVALEWKMAKAWLARRLEVDGES